MENVFRMIYDVFYDAKNFYYGGQNYAEVA